jgi:fumarate reductase flavoprotein subunit
MAESQRSDLVVIGGGVAGLVAASRAAEFGLSVVVLEQGEDERYLCNSRLTGGFFHVAMNAITRSAEELRAAVDQASGGAADPELRDGLAEGILPAVTWLKQRGVRFVRGGPLDWMDHVLSPPGLRRPGLNWQGRAGDVLLRDMAEWLQKSRGKIYRGHRAYRVNFEGDRVAGLTAERADGSLVDFAGAVLIADGGFQDNPDLVRKYISPRPEALLRRGAGSGRGDGLRMAQSAGAELVGLECFYGHVQPRDAMSNSGLWPYPILDILCAAGVVVDRSGRRFADEGLGGVHLSNAIARLDDPLGAVVIFDQAIWGGPGREYILPPNPLAVDGGARLVISDTIAEMAAALEIPRSALEASVSEYNAACDRGALASLRPPRSTHVARPYQICEPPYLAMRLCAGITYTMGGIHTDRFGRVLTANGHVIDGLYAAGSTTGGLEGGPRAGYIGGLSKAVAFGFASANDLAKSRQTNATN